MPRDPRAYLWDVHEAAAAIRKFTAGLDVRAYEASDLVQAAVERKFEVIGEALGQLSRHFPELAQRIPDVPQIVAFRNQLIHGYATIRPATVWGVAHDSLPSLIETVTRLLHEQS